MLIRNRIEMSTAEGFYEVEAHDSESQLSFFLGRSLDLRTRLRRRTF